MDDNTVEKMIVDSGAVAPRVTPNQIDDLMRSLTFVPWLVPGTTTTVVVSVLPSGFVVALGTAAAVSKDNFNAEIGIAIAADKCRALTRDKLWELEGYALRKALDVTAG